LTRTMPAIARPRKASSDASRILGLYELPAQSADDRRRTGIAAGRPAPAQRKVRSGEAGTPASGRDDPPFGSDPQGS
jgi:hypothetical protein